ncbi:Tyrosine--tRNA ligase [Flavobacterium sp. 9AF]|nr:Tyrosine--tRNA ligase [Flavobacterium sp. 9AF]
MRKLIIKMKNLVEELRWRGLIHDMMPGTEEQLVKESTTAYIGFDPTSDSLHIGSLVPIILLMHLRKFGHKPIALVGGATGMIGDPSGKSNERNLLDEATLNHNVEGIKRVLSRFLDFNATDAAAPILVNNYDWMKDFSFINFARDVGKRITVNYMMAKDSVKKRLSGDEGSEGMSFTEFTYQLIQGYDFYHLNKEYNCLLQMGGSDQWGNITTGTELVRRMNVDNEERSKAYAMTCPLITKADGSKFGKSEGGNVWLDADKTTPYTFYQFWLNTTDVDAEKYIKIFTFLDEDTVEKLIAEHNEAPHLRVLQKRLAEELMILVHSKEELERAIVASNAFFSKDMVELNNMSEDDLLNIFKGIKMASISKADFDAGLDMVSALATKTNFLDSNSDARRELKQNSVSLNKVKVTEERRITEEDLIANQFLLLQKGRKNYYVIRVK